MRVRRAAAPLLAGALLLTGAACGEEATPALPEDIDEGVEEGIADEPNPGEPSEDSPGDS